MTNFRNDHYYDPPDDEEAVFCEECNEEKEWKPFPTLHHKHSPSVDGEYVCTNPFCPNLFSIGDIRYKMAQYIVELEEKVDDLKKAENRLNSTIYILGSELHAERKIVEELLAELDTLRSQIRKGE